MLFDEVIFGPIHSRRLGLSLGINLINPTAKHCNFDCIYCECGWNAENPNGYLNEYDIVINRLEQKLKQMSLQKELPDTITFAGNGEPTMHPQFEKIVDQTIYLRNTYCPETKISVLSNATQIDKTSIFNALCKVDQNILKFDSAIDSTYQLINKPNIPRGIETQIELLKRFEGRCIIQTMLLKGTYNGTEFDNTKENEVEALIEAMRQIKPKQIMLYSIDRATPAQNLVQISYGQIMTVARKMEQHNLCVVIA